MKQNTTDSTLFILLIAVLQENIQLRSELSSITWLDDIPSAGLPPLRLEPLEAPPAPDPLNHLLSTS